MKIDLTDELARLVQFTAGVATAIRMYSAYNSAGRHEDAPNDLMWLSDCLHNFDMLGRTVRGGDEQAIVFACDMLSNAYEGYQTIHPGSTRQSKPAFDRNLSHFSLQEGIEIFRDIRSKVLSQLQSTS